MNSIVFLPPFASSEALSSLLYFINSVYLDEVLTLFRPLVKFFLTIVVPECQSLSLFSGL